MRDVAIVAYQALTPSPRDRDRDQVEMVRTVVSGVLEKAGLDRKEIGFWCSGSCDYLEGSPFAFVGALDALGAWPPISESHVEMDGAFALYEAWVHLQMGHIDTALAFGFGRSSGGPLEQVLGLSLDPYVLSPLGLNATDLAGLQAQALRDQGHDVSLPNGLPRFDGAAAVILAAGDRAEQLCERPAWIHGIDHRIDCHSPGARDLTHSPSTASAAQKAGVVADRVDAVFLHAPYPHEEDVLRRALGVGPDVVRAPRENPSMVAGLMRFGQAFEAIASAQAEVAVAHCTAGPCLQQNLVGRLEGGRPNG
ncbi:MAG: hypothetical protein ACI9WU_003005 [Myxococcota bacterium]|jgi:hypothetical protein